MAYGGLETMVKALLGVQRGGRADSRALADFVEKCRPDPFTPLPPPTVSESALDKIFRLPQVTDDHPLLAFLDLNPSNASTIHDWMVKGQPVDSWAGAIKLAKALRDATAHGALSASKVLEWRLLPTFEELPLRLGRLAAAALRQLARVPPPPEAIQEKPCPGDQPDTALRKPKRPPRKPGAKKGKPKGPDSLAGQTAPGTGPRAAGAGETKEVGALKAPQPDPLDEPL
jgi:hypothetical protein